MNNASILGRLTKDVDLRYSQAGKAVANFTLAVNRPFKNQDGEREADFIRTIAFGKTAETIANYVKKGQQLGIEGRIQTGSYENQQGKTVYTTDIVVNQFTFISEGGQKQDTQQQRVNTYNNEVNKAQQTNAFAGAGQQVDIEDSDLPF